MAQAKPGPAKPATPKIALDDRRRCRGADRHCCHRRLVFTSGAEAGGKSECACSSLDRGAAFRNLFGDPSQDYFADGITENLTTDLSRIRNSFVIGHNTAFTFKGKNIGTKEISKELGVRYVLEGSVQRDQNHVRVNAQLIDGDTGAHLWADRFEESITEFFGCKIRWWRDWPIRRAMSW